MQFFRTALTGKQIIASPLNKDQHATYHLGEVSIQWKHSLKITTHFYRKPLKTVINQQNVHLFISQVRFATTHLISFNTYNYRIIQKTLIFQCQSYQQWYKDREEANDIAITFKTIDSLVTKLHSLPHYSIFL